MMFPFLTLDDETEITHSEFLPCKRVKIYIEKPNEKDCFHHMTCYLPDYEIEEVFGFDEQEIKKYLNIIHSTAHLIIEFSKNGGFDNAAGF